MNVIKINISSNLWIPEYERFSYNEEDYVSVVDCLKSSHERKTKVEEQAILEFTFAINQVIENHRKKLTSLLINEHEYKLKRKNEFYFLEDFGWTTAYGLYHELSKE